MYDEVTGILNLDRNIRDFLGSFSRLQYEFRVRESVEREFVSDISNRKLLCFRCKCRNQIYLVNKRCVIRFSTI